MAGLNITWENRNPKNTYQAYQANLSSKTKFKSFYKLAEYDQKISDSSAIQQ